MSSREILEVVNRINRNKYSWQQNDWLWFPKMGTVNTFAREKTKKNKCLYLTLYLVVSGNMLNRFSWIESLCSLQVASSQNSQVWWRGQGTPSDAPVVMESLKIISSGPPWLGTENVIKRLVRLSEGCMTGSGSPYVCKTKNVRSFAEAKQDSYKHSMLLRLWKYRKV